jgi:hypothetical protein
VKLITVTCHEYHRSLTDGLSCFLLSLVAFPVSCLPHRCGHSCFLLHSPVDIHASFFSHWTAMFPSTLALHRWSRCSCFRRLVESLDGLPAVVGRPSVFFSRACSFGPSIASHAHMRVRTSEGVLRREGDSASLSGWTYLSALLFVFGSFWAGFVFCVPNFE